MEITTSILDYIGKYEGGVLVSIGLMCNDKFYSSIFYYTQDKMILNVEDNLLEDLGFYIEEHPEYLNILKSIIEKCEPYEVVIEQLEEIKIIDE
jgi:hypothetical protein